jgi:Kef-type K+ transport system membrane component KefB
MESIWLQAVIWVGLALAASFISMKIGVSVALVELVVGIVAGATIHPQVSEWLNFLASFGAVVLTFLAGAELESSTLKRFWKESLALGAVGFALPFGLCFVLARYVLHWTLPASLIVGVALSTTSVAVVYAVMVESGLNRTSLGKLILAACFVNDIGSVFALGFLFSHLDESFWFFLGVTLLVCCLIPILAPWVTRKLFRPHVSEPEVKALFLILLGLAWLAVRGGSEGVLPAYLVGMASADLFLKNREMVRRLRFTTFALLTPFYFLRAGSLVSLAEVWSGIGVVALLFSGKIAAKAVGLLPLGALLRYSGRANAYLTLMMCTGLTFGSISALYGYTHGLVSRGQYSILVVTVILTAILPTLAAQTFFTPKGGDEHV